ncbi:ATP-grasp domain-containing protein [Haloprofundus halobius]|uniref:carboxylate--amine ligase n=1 Tax=Haloprofundus halobius TaxID=2876194 RepID=UPI001CCF7254|nr:ATP-grasp domain-containing protein [Haloprofundus halobius]
MTTDHHGQFSDGKEHPTDELSQSIEQPRETPRETSNSVLVLDSHCRYALTAIRSLGRQGVEVIAASPTPRSAGSLSRYANGARTYPSPNEHREAFLSWLEAELRDGDYGMVLPVAEATVRPVTEARERFDPHTVVPFLPYDRLLVGLDKSQTIRAARRADVACPETLFLETADYDRAVRELGKPLVVKARRGSSRTGVYVCDDRAVFVSAFEAARTDDGPPLVQEYVPDGGERGVYTVYDCEGSLLGLTIQHRLRSSHDDGGASTYRETVDDPELRRTARRLLEELDWRGVAMVEFRIDARTGEAKLMEINPRLWGSLALTVKAGVDVPYLLYRTACFGDAEPTLTYDSGVRMRWFFGDMMRVSKTENRLAGMAEFVSDTADRTGYDVLSMDDPLPVLGSVEAMFRNVYSQTNGMLSVPVRRRRTESDSR